MEQHSQNDLMGRTFTGSMLVVDTIPYPHTHTLIMTAFLCRSRGARGKLYM
jgi:hypothetical protein